MTLIFIASLAAVGLFLGMLMLFEVGWFIGKRRLTRDPDGAAAGAGPAEASGRVGKGRQAVPTRVQRLAANNGR